jgi:large subunit ribosomal protein L17
MKHRIAGKKLGRSPSHRAAMMRNLMCSVLKHERVVTTLEKAKAVRPNLEKIVTLGRTKTLHSYRLALSRLQDEAAVAKLFAEIGPRYANRPGGYTRIVRLSGYRIGDGGSKAIFELVDNKVLEGQLARVAETEDE